MKRKLVHVVSSLALCLPLLGCREEGPVEKAGRVVDETVEKLQHGDEGAMEKAGRKVDEAVEDAKKKLEGS